MSISEGCIIKVIASIAELKVRPLDGMRGNLYLACGFTAGFISPHRQPMNTEKQEN